MPCYNYTMDNLQVLVTSDSSGQQWNSCVWDPIAGTSLLTFKGSTSAPRTLATLGNEYLLAASPNKSVIQVWSLHKTVRNLYMIRH